MDMGGKALLAPMSTFTNLPFRLLCQRHGAQGAVVPLVSAKAILMHDGETDELDPDPSERFVGVQVFGASSDEIGKAARLIAKRYGFISYIDINCACPVKKVVKTGAGSALLRKGGLVAQMIKAAGECGLPVTVKIRKAADLASMLSFCRSCEAAGAEAIFVHGRLPSQGYSGKADWSAVSQVAREVAIPVIGSGDIRDMGQGRRIMAECGCAGFMIGRAAMSDPGIFSSPPPATRERKRSLFSEYWSLCDEFGRLRLSDLKSKAIQMFSGFGNSTDFRARIGLCKSYDELSREVGGRG
jgi:tRNA-dihydrouridine synthase B